MQAFINNELRMAIEAADGAPIMVLDRVLQRKYVILAKDDYDWLDETLAQYGVSLDDVFRVTAQV